MKQPSPSAAAWAALGIGVTSYDLLCPEGQTLSEGFRRGLEHPIYKYLCAGGLGYTALHLLGVLPPNLDLFHQTLKVVKNETSRYI